MSGMTLYEIDGQIKGLIDSLMDAVDEDGVLVNDNDTIFEQIESLKEERKTKLENIALYIKNLEADAEAIKSEEERLKKRRERLTNKAEGLRWYMTRSMVENNDEPINTPRCRARLTTSEVTTIIDEDLIPEKYTKMKVEIKPDKTAIKKAIKSGEEVAGAIIETNTKVRIE